MAKHLFDHKTAKAKQQLRPVQAKPSKAKHRAERAKCAQENKRDGKKRERENKREERLRE